MYGNFVWAHRALNNQKRRFPARADKICAETLGVPPEAALDPKIEYKLKMLGARRLAMAGLLMLIDHNRPKGFEPTSTPCEHFRSLC